MRILLLISILFWFPLKGQRPFYPFAKIFNDVSYEEIRNEPQNANNLAVTLVPLYMDLYKPNSDISAGYEVGISYRTPNDKIHFDARFRNAYYDRIYEVASTNPNIQIGYPVNGSSAAMAGTGVLTYNFRTKEMEKNYYVLFKETYATRYYLIVPADLIRQSGFRIGADYYKGEYKFSKGITGAVMDNDTSSVKTFTSKSPAFFTMVNYVAFSIGISSSTIRDLKTIVTYKNKDRNRGVYGVASWYLDLLFAPVMTIDNTNVAMNFDSNYGWYNFHKIDMSSTQKLPFGFRLGVQEYSTKGIGYALGAEVGLRPGPVSDGLVNNLYLTVKYGFSLSALFLKKKSEG